jgi:hypothetical protein
MAAASRGALAPQRMLAPTLVLAGVPRAVAAETCAMDRQTLRDRVHRDNADVDDPGRASDAASGRR